MTALLTITRAVHFGSCLILQAVFPLLFLIVYPAWSRAAETPLAARIHFHGLLWRLLAICLLAGLVSAFLWFWLAVASMSGSSMAEALQPRLLWIVLSQTQPGQIWFLRALIFLAMALALPFSFSKARPGSTARWPSIIWAILALGLTASMAWLGHAGASEGLPGTLQLANDALHLVMAGIWPAGLIPFALLLHCYLRARDPASLLWACQATRRFSQLSLGAVTALTLSGAVNSYLLVGTWSNFLATDYGRLLLLKLSLFAVAVAFGGLNLFVLKPRLATIANFLPGETHAAVLAKISRHVWIEIILGTAILFVTGLLGITSPSCHS